MVRNPWHKTLYGNNFICYHTGHKPHSTNEQYKSDSFSLSSPLPLTTYHTLRNREKRRDRQFNVLSWAMVITSSESRSSTTKVPSGPPPIEVLSVKCESCGFTEECTPAYIHRIKERYQGRWICGLCVEAVKDEVIRSDMLISTEEALNRHISFYKKFRSLRSSSLKQGAEHPISAMGRVLRRSMDSPRHLRSSSSSDLHAVEGVRNSGLVRSESCVPCLPR